jgi:hypothetical protein
MKPLAVNLFVKVRQGCALGFCKQLLKLDKVEPLAFTTRLSKLYKAGEPWLLQIVEVKQGGGVLASQIVVIVRQGGGVLALVSEW